MYCEFRSAITCNISSFVNTRSLLTTHVIYNTLKPQKKSIILINNETPNINNIFSQEMLVTLSENDA